MNGRLAPAGLSQELARLATVGSLIDIGSTVVAIDAGSCRIAGLPPGARLGSSITIEAGAGEVRGELTALDRQGALVQLYGSTASVSPGTTAWVTHPIEVRAHASWKGRVLDALARPIDGNGPLTEATTAAACDAPAPAPLGRGRVLEPLRTGVRAVDLFTPLCRGQRMGIFAGSGVGKSTLLAMLARSHGFDSIVLALVGERGREVREFLEDVLGGIISRTIAIVSTSDEPAMMRRLAPRTATAIAETLRDAGEHVLLLVDSITRYAHALRDIRLTAGEPPVSRGYPPGVLSDLSRLLERAGTAEGNKGSITGAYTVLVDGDDHNDPIADAMRGILDGHIVLTRAIAAAGRYPAIDLLTSLSRLAGHCHSREQQQSVEALRAMVARFEDTRDIRLLGGHKIGADPTLDEAVALVPRLYGVLSQNPSDAASTDAFAEVAAALDLKPGASALNRAVPS